MKKSLITCTLLASTLFAATSYAQIYDGFETPGDYTAGSTVDGGSGGTGWASNWSAADPNRYLADSSSLNYSDGTNSLITTDGSLSIPTIGGSNNITRDFATPTAGDTVWFSFISDRTDNLPGNFNNGWTVGLFSGGNILYGVTGEDDQTPTVWSSIQFVSGGGGLQSTTLSGTNIQDLTFVVGQVANMGTASTELNLWLNPADLTDLNLGNANYTSGTFNGAVANQVGLSVFGNRGGFVDEFRVGSTLADVVVVPEPTSAALLIGATSLVLLRRRR